MADANRKRAEIIEHAIEALWDQGFSLGVDAIAADTGVSKRTLYKYFPSKEDLVVELLGHYRACSLDDLRRAIEQRSPDPRGRLRALFEVRRDQVAEGEHRGCFAVDALVEYRGRHPRIEAAAEAMIEASRAYVRELCETGGYADPAGLADEVQLLFHGAIVGSQAERSPRPFDVAIEVLDRLLAARAVEAADHPSL